MTDTTAIVATPNAAKYMTQLCKHWSHRFETELDDTTGRAQLPGGTVVFEAQPDTLKITLHPSSEEACERMKSVVAEHVDRFAFREGPLNYSWT